jgi:MFS family permease
MLAPSGKKWKLISLFSIVATLTNFLEGFSNSYVNTSGDSFEAFIKDSYARRGISMTRWRFTYYWSLFLNIWFIGYLIGTLITPLFCDKFGRKSSFLEAQLI